MTSLSTFIQDNVELILTDWETFARSVAPAGLSIRDLRDDAQKMLAFIAADMGTRQSEGEQERKSEGRGPQPARSSAAQDHGAQRFGHGFDMNGMVSEYRALRATVIRLWASQNSAPMQVAMQQLVRFNEGLDQAITESIARYTHELDKSRDLFLAALGHDVRTPLSAISITAETMLKDPDLVNRERGARILRSTRTIRSIANDLLDFTRARMGGALPVQVETIDAGDVVEGVLRELRPAYPERHIILHVTGDSALEGDPQRIAQALTNLVQNALKHGSADVPVRIGVAGTSDEVVIEVRNGGEAIAPERLERLFEPWKPPHGVAQAGNSGLGLYIVRQMCEAHDGTVGVASSAGDGTIFTVRLPRAGPRATPPTRQ